MSRICQITRKLVVYLGAGRCFEHYILFRLRPDGS